MGITAFPGPNRLTAFSPDIDTLKKVPCLAPETAACGDLIYPKKVKVRHQDLDGVIAECARLAVTSQAANGHAVITGVKKGIGKDDWSEGNFVIGRPRKSDDL